MFGKLWICEFLQKFATNLFVTLHCCHVIFQFSTKTANETYCWNICSESWGVPFWKLPISSLIFEKGFLENLYLFGSYKTRGKSLENNSYVIFLIFWLQTWFFHDFSILFLLFLIFWFFFQISWTWFFRVIYPSAIEVLLENWYVRWTRKVSWETPDKGAPGRKERIFSKIVSLAASVSTPLL